MNTLGLDWITGGTTTLLIIVDDPRVVSGGVFFNFFFIYSVLLISLGGENTHQIRQIVLRGFADAIGMVECIAETNAGP